MAFPVDAGFYLVSPAGRGDSPKLTAFRKWLLASVQSHPAPPDIPLLDTMRHRRMQPSE
jgi:hypothetical protein